MGKKMGKTQVSVPLSSLVIYSAKQVLSVVDLFSK